MSDLIAEARRAWPRMTCARGSKMWHYNRVIDALEEADRQLAELERGNRFRESVAEAERERAVAAEAALKVATDALEKIDEHSGSLMNVKRIAREALAAIRQKMCGVV